MDNTGCRKEAMEMEIPWLLGTLIHHVGSSKMAASLIHELWMNSFSTFFPPVTNGRKLFFQYVLWGTSWWSVPWSSVKIHCKLPSRQRWASNGIRCQLKTRPSFTVWKILFQRRPGLTELQPHLALAHRWYRPAGWDSGSILKLLKWNTLCLPIFPSYQLTPHQDILQTRLCTLTSLT